MDDFVAKRTVRYNIDIRDDAGVVDVTGMSIDFAMKRSLNEETAIISKNILPIDPTSFPQFVFMLDTSETDVPAQKYSYEFVLNGADGSRETFDMGDVIVKRGPADV
jgi:hypothetical protein